MLAQRCAPPTSLTSRVVCGGSHLSTLALPCSHLRTLAPRRALPTRPAPVPPAAAPANPYSTTPFLNAQITSCTRLCVPVFAMADDR